MSTRSMIAELVPTEPFGPQGRTTKLSGVYHHWDGYPEGLGASLWGLQHEFFHGDVAAMRQFLIHDHPAGWSTILGADFTVPPGFGGNGPRCYCHGERAEAANSLSCLGPDCDGVGCDPLFIEWIYVLADDGMQVYASIGKNGVYRHQALTEGLRWDRPEPDWKSLSATADALYATA